MAGMFGSNSQKPTRYLDYDLETSVLSTCIPLLWGNNRVGTNLIWLNNFQSAGNGGKGSGKGGGGKGTTSYTYSCALIFALCEGPVQSISTVWASGAVADTLAGLNLSLILGLNSQPPEAWITSNYPAQAMSYAQTAYLFSPLFDLQGSPSIPSLNFQVMGYLGDSMDAAGVYDANPADIILDYITSTQYGLDPTATYIDGTSMAFYKTYCLAQKLLLSPYLRTQEQSTQTLQRWAQLTNSWIFWNGVQLKFVPLGDQPLTANGATYTPVLTVVYSLGPDDFIASQKGGDLVTVTRIDPADGYNRVEIDGRDRENNFQTTPTYWSDQTSIDLYGELQAQTISADEVTDLGIAATMAALIGQRSVYIRNTYQFTTANNYILLEPGDIIQISDPGIGLVNFTVRITEIAEDANYNLKFTAEEFPGSIGQPVQFPPQANDATAPVSLSVAPGDVNDPPLILEPPVAVTGGQPLIWLGASGGLNWGGAQVYVSADGVNYVNIGEITSPTAQGTLTASLPSHADPDTVDAISVDMALSRQQLSSAVTTADADAFRTASLIDSEIVAYGTATATGALTDSLTYLRRGVYNTTPASHSSGAPFARIDPSVVFSYPLPEQYVGVTLYFKFASFNIFGNVQESVADATAYTYSPTGVAYTIAAPTGISLTASRATQTDGTTILSMTAAWTASAGPSLAGYEVQFSANGGSTWTVDEAVGASALSYTLAPALASTTYQARVRAISQNGLAVSTWDTSSTVASGALLTSAPATPAGLTAAAIPGGYTLNWTASTDPSILSYQVWQAAGSSEPFSSATQVQTVSAPATSVSITDQPASALTVFLVAVNAAGSSTATSGVNVTPLAAGTLGTIVVNAEPFLNFGTIAGASGTITAATQAAAGLGGWFFDGTSDIPARLAVGAGLAIAVTGSGTNAVATLTNTGAGSGPGANVTVGNFLGDNNGTITNSTVESINASGTVSITPTQSLNSVILNGPSAGGTVTVEIGAADGPMQKIITNVIQGATPAIWNFSTPGFVFGTTLPSFTASAVADTLDSIMWVANDGTHFNAMAINQGFAITSGGSAPVVNGATPTVISNSLGSVTTGETVTVLTASNSPTAWAIVGGSGYYAVDSSGDLTITSTGASDIVPTSGGTIYPVVVNATNAFGTSGNVTISPDFFLMGGGGGSAPVVNPASPFVDSNSAGLVVAGQAVATLTATNSPTAWAIAGGLGYFAIDNSGDLSITSTGASDIVPTSGGALYTVVVNATNGSGSSPNVSIPVTIYSEAGLAGAPIVTPSSPSTTTKYAGQVIATLSASNSPTSWAIVGGSGYFAINSSGVLIVTPTGATAIVPSSSGATYDVVVNATNGIGTSANVNIPVTFSTITVPLGADLTTYPGNSGSSYWATLADHWAGFVSALGVTPKLFGGAICANAAVDYTPCTPDTWPGTVSDQISDLSFLPSGTALLLTWCWQDNSGNTLYSDMATSTNTLYGGQLIAYWVEQTLAAWKTAGYTTLYLRPSWEWNIGLTGNGITSGTVATFVTAMQKFYTTCKTYAAANGMTVYICWDPSVFGAPTNSLTLASQFPNQTSGDKYVDVVCADFYAEGGSLANSTTSDPTSFNLTSIVALAEEWGLPIGICELGGLYYPSGGAAASATWIPNLVSYINSIGPNVPMAFASLWDVNTSLDATSNLEFTASGAGQSGIIAAWKAALGPTGTMKTIAAHA